MYKFCCLSFINLRCFSKYLR